MSYVSDIFCKIDSVVQFYKVFRSALNPDTLVLPEIWADQATLDVHAQVNAVRPPNPALAGLRAEDTRPREDDTYNQTR